MKKINQKTLALGASLIACAGVSSVLAENSPFGLKELSSGYMNTAEAGDIESSAEKVKEASCGEGKCGGQVKPKTAEGKCGEKMPGEKSTEGKCGEGKCGSSAK